MTALFQLGNFTLNSGEQSNFKIECDAFVDEDWTTLAWLLAERLPPFGKVEGVPRGGVRLAKALEEYARHSDTLLIVDDVWTTGGSMERHRAGRDAIGAVVFARKPVAKWVIPLFTMLPVLYGT